MRRDRQFIDKTAALARELQRPALTLGEKKKSPSRNSRSANFRPPLKGEAGKRRVLAAARNLPKDYVTAEEIRGLTRRQLDPPADEKPAPAAEQSEPRQIRNYWND